MSLPLQGGDKLIDPVLIKVNFPKKLILKQSAKEHEKRESKFSSVRQDIGSGSESTEIDSNQVLVAVVMAADKKNIQYIKEKVDLKSQFLLNNFCYYSASIIEFITENFKHNDKVVVNFFGILVDISL